MDDNYRDCGGNEGVNPGDRIELHIDYDPEDNVLNELWKTGVSFIAFPAEKKIFVDSEADPRKLLQFLLDQHNKENHEEDE